MNFKLQRLFKIYLVTITTLFTLFCLGYALDGSLLSHSIQIKDTVGVSANVKKEIKAVVADELSYFSDEFIDDFLQNTKFEIEIRDTYCYSSGFGRNLFLHQLDKYNFEDTDCYIRAYYEGNQGILRVHVYMQEKNYTANIKESLVHELGHYFDTADFYYSSSDEFMMLYEKYSKIGAVLIRTTEGYKETSYPLSEPCELFAEMFAQYVKYSFFLRGYYPDLYHYFKNLLEGGLYNV